jgi:hypothetical protein
MSLEARIITCGEGLGRAIRVARSPLPGIWPRTFFFARWRVASTISVLARRTPSAKAFL